MFGKLRYYLLRAAEAPPKAVLQRIWRNLKPFALQPAYAFSLHAGQALRPAEIARQRAAAIELGRSLIERIRKSGAADPEFAGRARRRALNALEPDFTCLGFGRTPIPRGPEWHTDPFHSYRWPLRYFANIDYIAADVRTDVKIPWDLSCFQYLLWLAEGAIFDPDNAARYHDRFGEIVTDWVANNPPAYGVNWTCPMEVGIRAINLLVSFVVFAAELDESTCKTVIRSLAAHGEFIARFPEVSDVSGNHFLADLAGEVICRALTADYAGAAFNRSVRAFVEEAERQFEADGCQLERAPIYHRLCLDLLAVVLALAIRCGHPDAAILGRILDRGVNFCRAVGSASRKLPIIGDCDSCQILLLLDDARDYTGLEQFAAALETGTSEVSSDFAHWLLALSDRELLAPFASPSTATNVIATNDLSGLLSARHGDLVVVMRVGAQGLKGRAPHDHDDALSIWLSKGDRDLLTEEGCHSYTLDPAIRERYIGSRAHNVVQRRGRERCAGAQGSIFRTMRGAPTADSWHRETTASMAILQAALSTPDQAGQPFDRCDRTVTLHSPSLVEIGDAWSWAHGIHEAELNWHLGPGLRPTLGPQGAEIRDERDAPVMSLTLSAELPLTVEAFEYQYSPVYGFSRSCWGLRIYCRGHEEGRIQSTFSVNC